MTTSEAAWTAKPDRKFRDWLQDLAYSSTGGDEVEDLVALLAYAQQQLPGLQAVASGAIASDYQRTRVEHVSHVHCNVWPVT